MTVIKKSQIGALDVKNRKPETVAIKNGDQLKEWLKLYKKWADKENKTLATRKDIKSNQRDPKNVEGCEVLDKDSAEFNTLSHVFEGHENITLDVKHMVKIDQSVVKDFKNNDSSKIPSMFDDYMRAGDERLTGFLTELGTEKLLYDKKDELDVKILPDDDHLHCGDVLINDNIVEVKGAKMSSGAVNLTARHHGQSYTPLMEIKTGVMADAYLHNYILDIGEDGYIIGFVGLTQTNPETDGTLSNEPRIYSKRGTHFAIISQMENDFEPLTEEGLDNIQELIKQYPSAVSL